MSRGLAGEAGTPAGGTAPRGARTPGDGEDGKAGATPAETAKTETEAAGMKDFMLELVRAACALGLTAAVMAAGALAGCR